MQINLIGFSPLAESVHNFSHFSLDSFLMLSSVVFFMVFLTVLFLVRFGVKLQRLSEITISMHIFSSFIEDGELGARSALDGHHVAVLDGEAKSGGGNVLTVDAASA